jgi:N-acetylneuraminic acid mutarotase
MSGSDIVDQAGIYGTKGFPNAANTPGSRQAGVSWVDEGGDFWLFGGWGFDSAESYSDLNDLWHYNTTSGEWTWVKGSDTGNQTGTYGIKGTPAASNTPGGRALGSSWVDANGDFWLFGGKNYSCKGAIGWVSEGYRNDLWRYDISTSEWTWMSGSDIADQAGTYGTKGTPAAANIPGARWESFSWVDTDGDFWIFGGYGFDSYGTRNRLNDLWRYDPTMDEWTWVAGSKTGTQVGTYGTKGTPDAANIPGGRRCGLTWVDTCGNLWLYGGDGCDSIGFRGQLNDLWRYNISTGEWTWMSGSDIIDQAGTYGTKGVPAAANTPGARYASISWVDTDGDFWIFGGTGPDSTESSRTWEFNDLWRYNTTSGEWTWMSGSDTTNQVETYGIKGTPAAANIPGARCASTSWLDANGDFWLFGGLREDSFGVFSFFNDLWRYDTGAASVSTSDLSTMILVIGGVGGAAIVIIIILAVKRKR